VSRALEVWLVKARQSVRDVQTFEMNNDFDLSNDFSSTRSHAPISRGRLESRESYFVKYKVEQAN